ncbi:MAG: CehA/McbA family metallohydrolase [Oscillospiraceae bacterium]|nr:CehA/McbA family metallohydrolase [Oscillospiraceae bacterium]
MNEKWHACELHCHTCHSDGDFTVKTLTQTALRRRLDGICLTDHNTVSGWAETKNSPLPVLCGIEWTTYFGHMLVLGAQEYVDWRDASPDNIDEKIRALKAAGGIVGIAHPFQLGTPICTGGHWDFHVRDWSLVSYLEVWSEGCPYMNIPNGRAMALWHSLLDKGFHMAPTMGRDWHSDKNNIFPGACTYVCAGEVLTADGIYQALRRGRTVVSAGPLFTFTFGDGKTVGDSLPPGENRLKIIYDTARTDRMSLDYQIEPQWIRIITSGSETAAELPFGAGEAVITAEKGKWYSLELWGKIDEKSDCLIAVTGAVYC